MTVKPCGDWNTPDIYPFTRIAKVNSAMRARFAPEAHLAPDVRALLEQRPIEDLILEYLIETEHQGMLNSDEDTTETPEFWRLNPSLRDALDDFTIFVEVTAENYQE